MTVKTRARVFGRRWRGDGRREGRIGQKSLVCQAMKEREQVRFPGRREREAPDAVVGCCTSGAARRVLRKRLLFQPDA